MLKICPTFPFWPVVSYETAKKKTDSYLLLSTNNDWWIIILKGRRKISSFFINTKMAKKEIFFYLLIDSSFLLNNLLCSHVSFKWSWRRLVYFSLHDTPQCIDFHLGTWTIVQLLISVRSIYCHREKLLATVLNCRILSELIFGTCFSSYFLLHLSVTLAPCTVTC